jgi:hypothetical protein
VERCLACEAGIGRNCRLHRHQNGSTSPGQLFHLGLPHPTLGQIFLRISKTTVRLLRASLSLGNTIQGTPWCAVKRSSSYSSSSSSSSSKKGGRYVAAHGVLRGWDLHDENVDKCRQNRRHITQPSRGRFTPLTPTHSIFTFAVRRGCG